MNASVDVDPDRVAGGGGNGAAAYVAALGAVAVAVAARSVLDLWIEDRLPFLTFFAAIVFSAWRGGLGPGLLAVVLGGICAKLFIVPPLHSLEFSRPDTRVGFLAYAVVGVFIAVVMDSTRTARRRAEDARRLLEREVAARIAAQNELAEREELLRITIAGIGDAVVTTDAQGNVVDLNAEARTLTGWAAEEARGRPLSDVFVIVNEQTRLPVESPVEKVLRDGRTVGLANHTILVAKDGSERPVDDSAAPIRDRDGRLVGVVLIFRDIGERRKAEVELSRSEERFRLAAEAVDGLIYEYDFATGRVERTRGLFEVLGYRPDEVPPTAEWWSERIHPEDREHDLFADPSAISTPTVLREYRVRHKDGRWLHVEDRAALLRNDAAEPLKLVGCAVDVTDRKRAEAALAEGEERFRLIAESANDGIWQVDAARRTVFANPRMASLLGCEPHELADCLIDDHCFPEDAPAIRRRVAANLAGESEQFDFRFRRCDGAEVLVLACTSPVVDSTGRVTGSLGMFSDITDRKRTEERLLKSEARFRSMADATPALIWTADPNGVLTFHNRRWLEYVGIPPEDNVRGWPRLVLHPDDYDRSADRWLEALRTGNDYEIEARYRRHDGEYRWFLTRATPIRDAAGRIVEWYGSTTDIHDRKTAEEALKEADRLKDEFLATLAHELRNPLAPTRNSLELMKRANGDAALIERARDTMERQIGQMVRLIDDLLDVSRITRNKLVLKTERVDLATAVRHAVEACRSLVDQAGHDLEIDLPSEPIVLTADPTRLTQVFGNLLSNACKYTDPGGEIRLAAERTGNEVVASVRDTGVGIPAEMLPRVFDLFTQVDRTLERSQGGLGIGLSLVKRLVEMHGGSVTAHSDGPDQGSEFVVRLPISVEPVEAPVPDEPSSTPSPARPRKVLVVDDSRDSAESLAMLLRLGGDDTATAHDGLEAVARADAFRPDAILMDIGLPKLNGYDACRRIREESWGKDILMVALTGWGQEEDRRKSRQAGFDGHLVKPVDLDALMKILADSRAAES